MSYLAAYSKTPCGYEPTWITQSEATRGVRINGIGCLGQGISAFLCYLRLETDAINKVRPFQMVSCGSVLVSGVAQRTLAVIVAPTNNHAGCKLFLFGIVCLDPTSLIGPRKLYGLLQRMEFQSVAQTLASSA